MHFASADVFADEMRFGDGNVKFRRLDCVAARRVFDDEAFEFGVRSAELRNLISWRCRQVFQAEKFSDAVLQMHDQIAFLQIREINVERGTCGQRVRRFQPARTLDFVAPENFRIGDDDQFGFVADETTCERANSGLGSGVWSLGRSEARVFPKIRDARSQTQFRPDFLKPLPLAVVVAENVDGIILSQPAMNLLEKFAPLRLCNLWFGHAVSQRTESIERG